MKQYVTYYRVSTKEQGKSGLGLEAQKEHVERFLERTDAEVIETYTEIESGAEDSRPILEEAIQACESLDATLLVAHLSRLTRNVEFGFALKRRFEQTGMHFRILSPPCEDTLTFGINLTTIQHEREEISRRTKAALKALKDRGKKLGTEGINNLTDEGRQKAHRTLQKNAREDKAWEIAFEFIRYRVEVEGMSYAAIAEALNKKGYRTRSTKNRGGKKFHATTVGRVYRRFTETQTEDVK